MKNTFTTIREPANWHKYTAKLCRSCQANCCAMPVEITLDDLIRMDLAAEVERDEPLKNIARRLKKAGLIEHFNHKKEIFTLTRLASGDCLYLTAHSRKCTIYSKRPDTCRNHPHIGPRSGYCAYSPRTS